MIGCGACTRATAAVLRRSTGWQQRRRRRGNTHTRCRIPFGLAPTVFKRRWPTVGGGGGGSYTPPTRYIPVQPPTPHPFFAVGRDASGSLTVRASAETAPPKLLFPRVTTSGAFLSLSGAVAHPLSLSLSDERPKIAAGPPPKLFRMDPDFVFPKTRTHTSNQKFLIGTSLDPKCWLVGTLNRWFFDFLNGFFFSVERKNYENLDVLPHDQTFT